jgi:glycosyltransferase involved in cell wall biosynthesis
MRILCIATEFPPAQGYGLGRYTFEHCAALVAEGLHVDVACNNYDSEREHSIVAGMEVSNTPYMLPFEAYCDVAGILQGNVSLLGRGIEMCRRNGGYDLLQINDWLAASAAKALKEIYDLPVVVTMHDTELGKSFYEPQGHQQYIVEAERWVCEIADAVTTNSEFIARELVEGYQVPPEKIAITGCGVNAESFPSRADAGLFKTLFCGPGEQLVAFVGRLAQIKGPHILLEAIPLLAPVCPQARFVFAGDGQMRAGLERRAEELGIADRVRFVGHLRGQVLTTFYRAADLLVVPSLYEPLGMVALEGMVCGTPVIASDTGGLASVVEHGVSGIKATPNDPRSLAGAVARVLLNPSAAQAFGQAGQARAERHFRWSDVAKRSIAVYERVLTSAATQKQQPTITQG